MIFLEARDEVLIRRYSETRHRHPLQRGSGIAASIADERRLLEEVRETADVIIDTSDSPAEACASASWRPSARPRSPTVSPSS